MSQLAQAVLSVAQSLPEGGLAVAQGIPSPGDSGRH